MDRMDRMDRMSNMPLGHDQAMQVSSRTHGISWHLMAFPYMDAILVEYAILNS